MITFDEVLPRTVEAVEASFLASCLEAVTVIRDLKGIVRLLLKLKKNADGEVVLPGNWEHDLNQLKSELSGRLGSYWGKQIWREEKEKDAAHIAMQDSIFEKRKPWHPDNSTGNLNWYRLERMFSKTSWFVESVSPPWDLEDEANPAIVSFYSFKGGVGRTLAVTATALLLAQADKNVAVLDLDLESPGLGLLLLGETALPDAGIADYLIEKQVTEQRPNIVAYTKVQTKPELVGSRPIQVLTAGSMNQSFLEKIARLDFEGFVKTENPLNDLLLHVREEYKPDFILIDVRSGLHDLGGLSINGLSHLDVLFARNNLQDLQGLSLILTLLGKAKVRKNALVVHALVPPERIDREAHGNFLTQTYELFGECYYREEDEVPDIGDREAPYGHPIYFKEELQAIDTLEEIAGRLTDSKGDHAELVRLIGTYLERDTIQ